MFADDNTVGIYYIYKPLIGDTIQLIQDLLPIPDLLHPIPDL